ncbi:HAMP domain-containing sensor histidine kinase [Micromonospora sp. WMMD1102]|uniref:HAMP domain-containing sensor histidine kinase n=1 Tax=Micromonospora sp. WMMD1102 TaxID=3016105 RepID=UPI0024151CA7|nr:HAMP domain-containing sensor histidine kinase [Micromonospora sp. WMMD1102]MDG4788720.1 HAMP domain-containing sensor histidine kinase [Micromonospora sp. WMMD1102]
MRRRLTLLVAAITGLVLLAFLVPLAVLLRGVAADRAVVAATADVQALVPLVGTAAPDGLRLAAEQVGAAADRPVTVFLPDGAVLGDDAPRTDGVELAARGESLTVDREEGREILVAVQGRPDGTAVIRTFVPHEELTRGVYRSWLVLAGLGLALLLLGLAVADRLARSLTAPITELSTVSHRLAGAELTARATPSGPAELRAVANALNRLATRIQELLRDEREQLADLSHRLRTPLTSLRLESESLADPREAARITERVDAVERAVTGLIRQARRRGTETGTEPACDATAVVRERVAFWTVLAEDTGRAVGLDLADRPLPVRLPADELAAVLDALLGNVFAHTPDGTGFAVALAPRPGGGALLTVTDSGPGLPPALVGPAPAGVLERGASAAGSTGLGLDIARRAARDSGGRFALSAAEGGGARVAVVLGPPLAATGTPSELAAN